MTEYSAVSLLLAYMVPFAVFAALEMFSFVISDPLDEKSVKFTVGGITSATTIAAAATGICMLAVTPFVLHLALGPAYDDGSYAQLNGRTPVSVLERFDVISASESEGGAAKEVL